MRSIKTFPVLLICAFLWLISPGRSMAKDITVLDSTGRKVNFSAAPKRVVSLVPTATEILYALGQADKIKGLTYHDLGLGKTEDKTIVGGFARPNIQKIRTCHPDLVIISPWQDLDPKLMGKTFCFNPKTLQQGLKMIEVMGKIFGQEKKARGLIQTNLDYLALIKKKVDQIPAKEHKRVVRLMGREKIMTPGDESFQNELIKAAGGIPPKWGKKGSLVSPSLKQWLDFNPQVIYGCGGERSMGQTIKATPWGQVEAVRDNQVFYFPCQLTCRPGINMGYFVAWLSSILYPQHFAKTKSLILPEKTGQDRNLPLSLPYVRQAKIVKSTIFDFTNKTLIIEFSSPQKILSTLEGERSNIMRVGNHYSPPPCWSPGHKLGLQAWRQHVYQILGVAQKESSFLFTGADMDNLALGKAKYREMAVTALVTAGVRSNALRMSADQGNYYEPGTINIIILSNMKLTPRAMARAIISATEAKTAALSDLDIRSTPSPLTYQATGTGTDNIIVVQGTGTSIDNSGGHSKMGELIARAVHQGVILAIGKQNKIYLGRLVLARLQERNISPYSLVRQWTKEHWPREQAHDPGQLMGRLETTLLRPRYQGFVQSMLAINDCQVQGNLQDINAYKRWCLQIACELAGSPITAVKPLSSLPPILGWGLGAILTGLDAQ